MPNPILSHIRLWRFRQLARILCKPTIFAVIVGFAAMGVRTSWAQVASETSGVSVSLQLMNVSLDGNASSYAEFSVTGLNGYVGTSTASTGTFQVMARLAVGETYDLMLGGSGVIAATIQALPPVGYEMEIERVVRDRYSISGESTLSIRVRPPKNDAPARGGVATSLAVERTLWQVSLGSLSTGDSAGALAFIDTGGSGGVASIFTPAGLVYSQPSSEVAVIPNDPNVPPPYASNTPRQIIAPQVCVDIVVTSSDQWHLKFYHRSQLGSPVGSLYQFTGDPFAWYVFDTSGGQPDTMAITCHSRDIVDTNTTGYPVVRTKVTTLQRAGSTWTSKDWYTGSVALSENTRSRTGSDESVTVAPPSQALTAPATKITRSFVTKAWGEEVVSETRGTTAPVVTNYQYWDSVVPESAAYARLRSMNVHGMWEAYEYYDYLDGIVLAGAIRKRHRPFNDSSASPPGNLTTHTQGEVTSYEWTDGAFGRGTRPTKIETAVNGVVTSKALIAYSQATVFSGHPALLVVTATRTDYSKSNETLVSETKYFSEAAGINGISTDDFFRSRTHSETQPDGVKRVYAYQRGTWGGSTFTLSGNGGVDPVSGIFATRISTITGTTSTTNTTPYLFHDGYNIDDVQLVNGKSTMDVTVRDNYARVVRNEKHVWYDGSWHLLEAVSSEWNLRNQITKRARNSNAAYDVANGVIYEATYEGEYLASAKDESGIHLTYTYDAGGRVEYSTKNAATAISALTTKFTNDAANRVIGEEVGWGLSDPERLVTTRTYDAAGRLQNESVPGPNGAMMTGYVYDPSNRRVTTLLPNGGDRVEIKQMDGKVAELSGSAVVPAYYTYSIESDGLRYVRINSGTRISTRVNEQWTDWMGRTRRTSRPGYLGLGTIEEEHFYEIVTPGRLSKIARTGLASTLYRYDALGAKVSTGLDLDGDNTIDYDTNERVSDTDAYFEYDNQQWWRIKVDKTYPVLNSATALTLRTTRERLTGFSGNTRAETIDIDVNGNTSTRIVSVDRVAKEVTTTTTKSGITVSEIAMVRNGLPVSVTRSDPASNYSMAYTTGYDSWHRKISFTAPRVGASTTEYRDGSAFVAWERDPANRQIATYTYDSAGRVIAMADVGSNIVRTDYGYRNEILHRWGLATLPVEFGYNQFGERITMKTFRDGANWNANTWSGTSPGTADVTTWNYDESSGFLSSKRDADNKSVTYTYNNRGQMATRTWARNVTTTYTYAPGTGDLTGQSYPAGTGTPSVGYVSNRAGGIESVTDATGTRNFKFGIEAGSHALQLDRIDYPAYFDSRRLKQQYDSIKRPTGFQLGTASLPARDLTQTHQYDTIGRFYRVSTARGSQAAQIYEYSYNVGGVSSDLPSEMGGIGSAFSVAYDYDPQRDLRTLVNTKWNGVSRARYDYVHNGLGQRYTAKQSGDIFDDFGGSIYRRHVYDPRGQVQSSADYLGETPTPLGGAPVAADQLPARNFAFDYDDAGNRKTTSRTGTVGVETYSRTAPAGSLNQYSSRTNDYAHAAGTVGAASGITVGVTDGGGSWSVTPKGRYWAAQLGRTNGDPHTTNVSVTATSGSGVETGARALLLPPQAQNFVYDADGNLKNDGLWEYAYDAENRLTAIETATGVHAHIGVSNARRLEFEYDYLNRRVQKLVRGGWNGSVYTTVIFQRRYLYDGDHLIAELTGDGTSITKSFTWGLDLTGSTAAAAGVGGLLQTTDHATNTSYFPAYDGNGNVVALLHATSGAPVAKYEYSPFGELLRCEGTYATSNPLRFSSKFYDDEVGLVYYGMRYYSPSLGRFTNRDPIEEAGGQNLYGFCGNDPVGRVEFKGMVTVAPVVLSPFVVTGNRVPTTTFVGPSLGLADFGESVARNWFIGNSKRSDDDRTRPPSDAANTQIFQGGLVLLEKFYVSADRLKEAPNTPITVYFDSDRGRGYEVIRENLGKKVGEMSIRNIADAQRVLYALGKSFGSADVFRAKLAIYAISDPEGYRRNALRLGVLSLGLSILQGLSMPGFRVGVGRTFVADATIAAEGETAILTRLKDQAVVRFNAEGLTPAQQRLFIKDPSSFARLRGTQIDTFFKEAVDAHPDLQHLITTPRYKFGPDVFDPATQRWWDVTTPGKWGAHVEKYWLFGDGKPLFTQ
jgi:RHS repeat-associated protein